MNKQSANYVESVGDPMPRKWQDKKHNITWLCVVLSVFVLTFVLFALFNSTKLETADISLTEQNENNCILGSTIYVTYAQGGDFNFSANGEVTFRQPESWWKRKISPASLCVFAQNLYDQDRIIKEDTLTTLNFKGYKLPDFANSDPMRKITDEKEYIRYSDLLFSAKIKSSLVSLFHLNRHIEPKILYGDLYRFEEKDGRIKRDTIISKSHMHLYAKRCIDTIYASPENDVLIDSVRVPEGIIKRYQRAAHLKTNYVFNNSSRHSYDLSLFRFSRYVRFYNRTCCNLFIRSIEFPCKENCRLVLSFSSPMYFDKLSIKPDIENPNEIIYSSPEKIRALQESGLYVYARDISINYQDMLNFLLATFLGIMISYIIEFVKRLYTARKDKQYARKELE